MTGTGPLLIPSLLHFLYTRGVRHARRSCYRWTFQFPHRAHCWGGAGDLLLSHTCLLSSLSSSHLPSPTTTTTTTYHHALPSYLYV